MEEAERLCDRIVILDHGRVIADDTLQGLYRLAPASNVIAIDLEDRTETLPAEPLRALAGVTLVETGAGTLRVGVTELADTLPVVLRWLTGHGHPYRHVVTERADLESVS